MKKERQGNRNPLVAAIALIFIILTFGGCDENCTVTNEYVYFEPVYTSFQELRSAVEPMPPHELAAPGKIYFKDDFLYISERAKGIHVIDNSDPSNPLPVSFINIPGNFDLAILDNVLYADSYTDLVALDISVPANAKEVGRFPNLFGAYSSLGFQADPIRGVVTDWVKSNTVTLEENQCDIAFEPWGGRFFRGGVMFDMQTLSSSSALASAPPTGSTGVAGSMARFTIKSNFLYALDGGSLAVVKIPDPQHISVEKKVSVSWDIETIFPYTDKLFLGSRTGMYIFSLSAPASPALLSMYSHMRSCDPVVVEGDYAYVTLRSGNTCNGFTNQLEVIDIKDVTKPVQVKIYPMTSPHGLGIDSGTLFICDGKDGLKIFDSTDKLRIAENQLAHYKDVQAFDIIPFQKIAMMIGEDGLYQYDYSDVKHIKLLSHLTIKAGE